MAFKDLKITCIKADGPCSRTKAGAIFYIKNACLEIPEGQKICLFALNSLIMPLSNAIMEYKKDNGDYDPLKIKWQCPDAEADVVFEITEM